MATKVVYFDVNRLDKFKRKQLQSLAKRTGMKANGNSDQLREALRKYHKENSAAIDKLGAELKHKRAEGKSSRKRKISDELQSTLNWPTKKTNID